jgi:cysteine synthase A
MIDDAEAKGRLQPGGVLVEPTSGNTGIALAMISAARGYRLILTMPEVMSAERMALLRAFGAEIELTPGALMVEAVARAHQILKKLPKAIMLQQFENPANPAIHRTTTAAEILAVTPVDVFVAGVGTGGTITGVGEAVKAKHPGAKVVAVEPASAAVLSGRTPAHHMITGIGAGFVPKVLNRAVIDEVMTVADEEAFAMAGSLAHEEGLSLGFSSGAAVAAAMRLAKRPEMNEKTIVVMLPDGGERYLSHPAFGRVLGR